MFLNLSPQKGYSPPCEKQSLMEIFKQMLWPPIGFNRRVLTPVSLCNFISTPPKTHTKCEPAHGCPKLKCCQNQICLIELFHTGGCISHLYRKSEMVPILGSRSTIKQSELDLNRSRFSLNQTPIFLTQSCV